MPDCILNIDWKFWIGDIIIPIATFVGGIFVGRCSLKISVPSDCCITD